MKASGIDKAPNEETFLIPPHCVEKILISKILCFPFKT
jgi:hypothetical protein